MRSLPARSTQPSTLHGTVNWVVTHLYGLRKVGTLVQPTGVAKLAPAPACVCRLHTLAVRQAALVSDKSALEACLRRCAIQIDDFYLFYLNLSQAGRYSTKGWVGYTPKWFKCPQTVTHPSNKNLTEPDRESFWSQVKCPKHYDTKPLGTTTIYAV